MTDPRTELFQVQCGPVMRSIMNELAQEYQTGSLLTIETLADRVYPKKVGGKIRLEDRLNSVKVMISQCRKKIEPLGWTITRYGYRLERLREKK